MGDDIIQKKKIQHKKTHWRKRSIAAILESGGYAGTAVKSLYDFLKAKEIMDSKQDFMNMQSQRKSIMSDIQKQIHAIRIDNITEDMAYMHQHSHKFSKQILTWVIKIIIDAGMFIILQQKKNQNK